MGDFISFDQKKMKKLLKNSDFMFCIISYPIVLVVYIFLSILIANVNLEEYGAWYTIISFLIFAFATVMSIFERVEKRALHKVQGDKLRLKQKENNWKS